VSVGLYALDIADINDVAQSFTARFALRVKWKDPRLAALAHCKIPLDQVWNPRVRFLNRGELVKTRKDLVVIDPQGGVTYTQGFEGTLAVSISLREFPFDHHVLPFTMLAIEYGPEEVLLVVNDRITARSKTFSIPDWSIGPGATRLGTWYFAPQDRNFSRFDYEFVATRRSGFYVWKVIVPLTLFIFMSWAVFWLDPVHLGTQVGLSATTMVIRDLSAQPRECLTSGLLPDARGLLYAGLFDPRISRVGGGGHERHHRCKRQARPRAETGPVVTHGLPCILRAASHIRFLDIKATIHIIAPWLYDGALTI
jgi:hypothetical protein